MSTVIYGGSLAALVAAERLAAEGQPVTLVTPSAHLGGHFVGAQVDGARFDGGLVIFEYGALNAGGEPDPVTYDPDVRNDCGRFGHVLQRYTESLGITLHRVPAFRLWTGGALIPDFVFDVCLEGFQSLPSEVRQQALAEVRAILDAGEHPLHARRKYTEPRYAALSYEEASLANHGRTLHERFFDPFVRKVTGHGSRDVLALYSRAAWLPLFWPETLAASLADGSGRIPETPFHAAQGGAVADLVPALLSRLATARGFARVIGKARALRAVPGGVELDCGETVLTASSLVWGQDVDELARLTGAATTPAIARAPVTIVLARVPVAGVANRDLGTIILAEDHALPYRITNQSSNAGMADEPLVRISAEWGGADAPADDAELLERTREALVRIGMLDNSATFASSRIMRIPRALVLPSLGNREALVGMRRAAEATGLPVFPVAPAAGLGVASLNDQLVQGMKAARLAADRAAAVTRSARAA